MSLAVDPARTTAEACPRDTSFLSASPWAIHRAYFSRTLIWVPLVLVVAAAGRSDAALVRALTTLVAGAIAVRLVVEVRRAGLRGWVIAGINARGQRGELLPRGARWIDPSGEWVPASDSVWWRPLRIAVAVTHVLVTALLLAIPAQAAVVGAWLLAVPVVTVAYRHIPTASTFDVAYRCDRCERLVRHAICRTCGHVGSLLRPPTEYGSLRRTWRHL